ncbi:MAG: hypothetical protein AB1459_21715 [Pseudomonadota bacterium]
MGHPIFKEAPSTDMTKAQERQAELDAQIEAFLAKGGVIKAYDNFCRPVESGPWRSKSIHPEQQQPAQAAPVKAKTAAPVKAKPAPVQTEGRLVQNERGEVRLAEIPVPASITASSDDAWRQLRRDIAATKRRLDKLGKKVAGQ